MISQTTGQDDTRQSGPICTSPEYRHGRQGSHISRQPSSFPALSFTHMFDNRSGKLAEAGIHLDEIAQGGNVNGGKLSGGGNTPEMNGVGAGLGRNVKKPDMQSTQNSAKVDSFQEGLYLLRWPIHATRSKSTKEDSTLDPGHLLRPEPASLLISLLHNVSLNSYEAFPSPRGNDCSRRRSALGQR